MFRKTPFILLAVILGIGAFSHKIPDFYQAVLYSLSLSIKSLIVFVLPFVVFSLLFRTAAHFAHTASKIIVFMLIAICCSNFLSTLFSYSVGTLAYQFDLSIHFPDETNALLPIWDLNFPKWINNVQAMFAGLLLGTILGWLRPILAKKAASKLESWTNFLLKGILLLIPLFITGFMIKMNRDQVLPYILHHYALIFGLIASAVFAYIVLIYFIFNQGQVKSTIQSLKNMLPAAIAGFGSMSSAAAMPLTILGAEKNAKDKDLAKAVIPATVNIHLVGDCFAIPIFAFAVMKSFGVIEPTFFTYAVFAFYFAVAKFSVAAVPGGGILVMLPILESQLGFNADMLSLITALYILFDPVITCANVLGNGGFAIGMEKLINTFSPNLKPSQVLD